MRCNNTLKTTQPLTAPTLQLGIAQTGGAQNTDRRQTADRRPQTADGRRQTADGRRQTLPKDGFTVAVQEESGALVYRWVLKPGRMVPLRPRPGRHRCRQHVFAATYNHAIGGRDAEDDTHAATPGPPQAPSRSGTAWPRRGEGRVDLRLDEAFPPVPATFVRAAPTDGGTEAECKAHCARRTSRCQIRTVLIAAVRPPAACSPPPWLSPPRLLPYR
jgi:hypothetical protein